MENQLKTLKIMHIAFSLGILIIYLVIGKFYYVENITLPEITAGNIPYILIPFGAIFLSHLLFKNHLKQLQQDHILSKNASTYATACIMRWAILEGAAMLILFLYPDFSIFGCILIAYLISLYPSESRLHQEIDKN